MAAPTLNPLRNAIVAVAAGIPELAPPKLFTRHWKRRISNSILNTFGVSGGEPDMMD